MDSFLFIVIVGAVIVVVGIGGVAKYIGHFKFGERAAARLAEYKIEHASADQALDDPLLRSLIACPSCRTAGKFDLIGKRQARCQSCGTTWDVA